MKKIILLLAFYASFIQAKNQDGNSVVEELKLVASAINQNTPRVVDDNATLMLVEQEGLKLTYIMQLNGQVEDLEKFELKTKTYIKSNLCKDKAMAFFTENNVVMEYSYLDIEGLPVTRFQIDLTTC